MFLYIYNLVQLRTALVLSRSNVKRAAQSQFPWTTVHCCHLKSSAMFPSVSYLVGVWLMPDGGGGGTP